MNTIYNLAGTETVLEDRPYFILRRGMDLLTITHSGKRIITVFPCEHEALAFKDYCSSNSPRRMGNSVSVKPFKVSLEEIFKESFSPFYLTRAQDDPTQVVLKEIKKLSTEVND